MVQSAVQFALNSLLLPAAPACELSGAGPTDTQMQASVWCWRTRELVLFNVCFQVLMSAVAAATMRSGSKSKEHSRRLGYGGFVVNEHSQ